MRVRVWLAAVVVMIAAVGWSPAADNPGATDASAVRRSIEAANARFIAAMKRGDAAAAMANYADDAIVMMPNEPAWRGRVGVSEGFAGFLSQMAVRDITSTTEDVMVGGDIAVETGRYEWTLQPKNGLEIKDKGKYMTVWKRQPDGSWKIVRDINNSDVPAKIS